MRGLALTAIVAAACAALHWRDQLRTQELRDAIHAAVAMRPTAKTPTPAVAPEPLDAILLEPGRATPPPYVIEAPDQLRIEVAVKNPRTGESDRLSARPVSGSFLVRPDGTVGLGQWGSVVAAGLTLEQAAQAVRAHVANTHPQGVGAEDLTVKVDVLAPNSKRYYVITDGEGSGEQVFPFPATGGETVLDAVAHVPGLPEAAMKRSVWVARRGAHAGLPLQRLPVEWRAITEHGITATNYQLQAGDRVYVKRAAE